MEINNIEVCMKLKYGEIMELEMMIQGLFLFSQWKIHHLLGNL